MHGCRGRSPQAGSCSGAPVHAVCHRESRDAVSCPTTGLSYRAAFSPSSPLLFFLCVTGSLNKPDYCSPLLKSLQCVSVACKMKGRWLVWLTEPPAASLSTCRGAGISVSALGHLPVRCVFHEARSQHTFTSPSRSDQFPTHPSACRQVSTVLRPSWGPQLFQQHLAGNVRWIPCFCVVVKFGWLCYQSQNTHPVPLSLFSSHPVVSFRDISFLPERFFFPSRDILCTYKQANINMYGLPTPLRE